MTTTMDRTRLARRGLLGVLAGASLMLAACGGDDDDDAVAAADQPATTVPATAPATDAGAAADAGAGAPVCAPYLEVTAQFNGEPDPATLGGLVDEIDAQAPGEIADQLGVMTTAVRTVLESGGADFSAFEAPAFGEAQNTVDPWMFEHCPFDAKLDVIATEYHYEGIPAEMAAGEVGLLVTNEGNEAHEIAIMRKNDGVTETWQELLELPEEEAMAKVTPVSGGFVPRTGSQALSVVDLEAGEYVAICFVPTGTSMSPEGEVTEGTGAPHFAEGMLHEFTVTA